MRTLRFVLLTHQTIVNCWVVVVVLIDAYQQHDAHWFVLAAAVDAVVDATIQAIDSWEKQEAVPYSPDRDAVADTVRRR